MADDGGDVQIILFRNNSFQKKLPKYSKTQLTTYSVSRNKMLIKKAMLYIQNKRPMPRLTA